MICFAVSAAECSEQYATAGSSQPLHPIFSVDLHSLKKNDCVLLWVEVKVTPRGD